MKKAKTILLSGILTMGVFSMVAYTSCSKSDKCDSIVCKNGGTCSDGVCKCPLGFEGANCETDSKSKFIGSFSATDNCPVPDSSRTSLNYSMTITSGSTATQVYVINLADASSNPADALTANLTSSKELTIEPKTLPNGRTYSGTIQYISAGKLSASFQVKENGQIVEACNTNMTK